MISIIEQLQQLPISKSLSLDKNGGLEVETCTLHKKYNFKQLQTSDMNPKQFIDMALLLKPHQAICTGYYLKDGIHSRSAKAMQINDPIIRLDIDYDLTGTPLELDDLYKIHPLLKHVWCVKLPSQSNVTLDGRPLNPHKMSFYIKTTGIHTSEQLKQLAKFLEVRAGNSFNIKAKISNGFPRKLIYTIIDPSVLKDITRIAFIQRPVLATSLEWNTDIIDYRDGPALNIKDCVLAFPEEARFRDKVNKAKKDIHKELLEKREEYKNKHPKRYKALIRAEKQGVYTGKLTTSDKGKLQLIMPSNKWDGPTTEIITPLFKSSICLNHITDTGDINTLSLEEGEDLDLTDPFEPDYDNGAPKSKLFKTDKALTISSFAHGHYTMTYLMPLGKLISTIMGDHSGWKNASKANPEKGLGHPRIDYNLIKEFFEDNGKYIGYDTADIEMAKNDLSSISGLSKKLIDTLITTYCIKIAGFDVDMEMVEDITSRYRMMRTGSNELMSLVEENYEDDNKTRTYPTLAVTKNLSNLAMGEKISKATIEVIQDKLIRIDKVGCYPLNNTPSNVLNMYMGIKTPLDKDVAEEEIKPWLFHLALIADAVILDKRPTLDEVKTMPIEEMINTESSGYKWLLQYISCFIHRQAIAEFKPAIEILGTHGSGKSLLGDLLEDWLSSVNCYATADWDDLLGHFNIVLSLKTFIRAEEATRVEGGNNKYKSLISGTVIPVEAKFGQKMEIPACQWVMSTSNSLEGSYVESTDRRTMIYRISSMMAGNKSKSTWWKPYVKWWKDGGSDLVLTYFYNKECNMETLTNKTGINNATLKTKLGYLEGKPTGFILNKMLAHWDEDAPVNLGRPTSIFNEYESYVEAKGHKKELNFTSSNKFNTAIKDHLNRNALGKGEQGYYNHQNVYWLDVQNAKRALAVGWNMSEEELEKIKPLLKDIFYYNLDIEPIDKVEV